MTFDPNPAFATEWAHGPGAATLMAAVAVEAEDTVKSLCGGHKRYEDSITSDVVATPEGFTAVIGIGGPSGFITRFAEFGTRHQPARPMLRPGVEIVVARFGGHFTPAKG